jgi:hypothetical protein
MMKKNGKTGGGGLTAALCLVALVGCALPMGLEYIAGRDSSATSSVTLIKGEDLGRYIPAPVAGRAPVLSFSAPYYTGTVEWMNGEVPLTGDFQADTEYTAVVTLYAFVGYAFSVPSPPTEGSFSYSNYIGGSVKSEINHAAGVSETFEAFISFEATGPLTEQEPGGDYYVADYNLQGYVPVPARGAVPVTAVNRGDMSISVSWKDDEGADITGSLAGFQEGIVYRAEITLSAKSGYAFDPDIGFGYPAGAVAELTGENRDRKLRTLAVVYKATEVPPMIESVDLSNLLSAPVTGASPVTSFFTGTWGGTAVWSRSDNGTPHSGLFQAATVYTATVTLSAAQGYVFGASVQVIHSGASSSPVTFTGEGLTVSGPIVFPVTKASDDYYVVDYNLQRYVPVPATGAVPVTAVNQGDMYVSAVWKDGAGTDITGSLASFQEGVVYHAEITLAAKSGYAFDPDIGFAYPAGAVTDLTGENSDRKLRTLAVVYQAAEVPPAIESVDLSTLLPAPVAGASPVPSFFAGTWGATAVVWSSGNGPHSGLFQAATAYTATVTLSSALGYTFGASVQVTHSGASSSPVTFTGGGLTVSGTIVFPKTEDSSNINFGGVDW